MGKLSTLAIVNETGVISLTTYGALIVFMDGSYRFKFEYNYAADTWDSIANKNIANKNKIRVGKNQPINTKFFEEAIVLEYNGTPTLEGLKERVPIFTREGEFKPIIDCIFRW